MSNPAAKIIEKFGGLSALAKALGHKNSSTVQGWKERGLIPQKKWGAVLEAAKRAKVRVSIDEIIGSPISRKSRAA